MSEYWKSTPKYWCKHCTIYVKDTPLERKQHENTGKHQGNLRRFLRGIQNDHERNERDKQKAKEEVERLNRVVGGSSTTSAPPTTTSAQGPSRKAGTSNLTAVDQKRQWAQLAEMGIAVPENFRGEMAMSGDWQTVSQTITEDAIPDDALNKGIRKRKLEDQDMEEESITGNAVRRGWGSSMKKYPAQKAEDVDLDSLLNAPILKKETVPKSETGKDEESTQRSNSTSINTVTTTQVGEVDGSLATKADSTSNTTSEIDPSIKKESKEDDQLTPLAGGQDTIDAPVFKKRKGRGK